MKWISSLFGRKSPSSEQVLHKRQQLIDAAVDGDCETVKNLVKSGVDVNTSSPITGMTPLLYAAAKGNFDLVAFLVDHGASVNWTDYKRAPALHYAAGYGDLMAVKYLVENGADVNSVDKHGLTAMSFATQNGNHAIVEYLNSKGVPGVCPAPLPKPVSAEGIMHCFIENTTDVELTLIYSPGGPLVISPPIPANSKVSVPFTPGNKLGDMGKKITLNSNHEGTTIQWPGSFF